MQSDRPQLSITLPRNFYFHYSDGQPPHTPEPEPQLEDPQPPPPPRQTLRVRRRRTAIPSDDDAVRMSNLMDGLVAHSQPIPTIEAPEFHSDEPIELPEFPPAPDNSYLSPVVSFNRMISPPKTPELQMRRLSGFDTPQPWDNMDPATMSESSSRPTSSSGFSDSSTSSRGSFESFPSFGGSCTSPDEDMTDPFSFCDAGMKYEPTSPLAAHRQGPINKLKLRATFTEEMDAHLWMTYMKYLQDPTVTPFKALPSTVPPNGVCHRVARMARKTWKGPRASSCLSVSRSASQYASRSGTPDTIKPSKSGSSTPIAMVRKPYPRFPSEKQARKRLRELAKQKPSLSAHYQRLLHHRTPSPFQSSPPSQRSSSQPQGLSSPFSEEASSFSTRDMNLSLATSTAASMQFGNPLTQLGSNATPRAPDNGWSNVRSSAHQKSQSLHIGLGIGSMFGSSFAAMSQMTDMSLGQQNSQTWHAPSAHPPRLGSPLQLHAPRPISRPFKRRALHNFEEQARGRGDSFVNHVFGAPAESSHRRVRSRGFSLGDMIEGARRLPASPFGPTEVHPFSANLTAMMQDHNPPPAPYVARNQATVRLGSPFGGRSSNTFPRATTSYGFEAPASFEQRLAGLPSNPDHLTPS
ncbi:uncharacterized protein BDR25DRAFT_207780 [Lindgomyces ingoldianus]|uniref:Uncharacterized protein n=1 Tax=Lindgomyces ingoldianus TaxID=673940 RepID=A0ACB6RG37_9PLEO|nr:uncharacterized protein BDR25DRAFT_207780 [Lindgomyces ingoldianus]KAF2478324.1 hypothetical protein BDR25DRAFT_207780 [Lindgomyces ingoldianus]